MIPAPVRRKGVLFRLGAAALGAFAGAGAGALALTGYLQWKVAAREDVSSRVARAPAIRQWLLDPAYSRLQDALEAGREESFGTTWDFDNAVALDRNLFVATEMYGKAKYRYRENTGVVNAVVWTGTHHQSLVVAASDEVLGLIRDCEVNRLVEFTTDEYGFKPTVVPGTGPGRKIFVVGDSFTEGLYISPEKTFASLLGQKLAGAGVSGVPVNLGVNGYSALEMSWMVEHFSPMLDPEAVIVNLFPNDVNANYTEVIEGRGVDEQDYGEMFSYLARIREHCEQFGRLLIISVIPCKEQFGMLKRFGVFQDRVNAWCETNGVRCLDPRNEFEPLGADHIYFSWDPHFSEEGHGHYAEFLYREIAGDLANLERAQSP